VIRFFLAPLAIIYGIYILWPNSHCERALHASIPAYWVGSIIHLASEPFIEEQKTLEVSLTTGQRLQVLIGDAVAWLFYNRESLQELCETDAIQLLRQSGRINDRGLVALPGERLAPRTASAIPLLPASAPETMARSGTNTVSKPPTAVDQHSSMNWLRNWWPIAIALFLIIALIVKPIREALTKVILEGKIVGFAMSIIRRLWMAHKQLFEHVLPRSVIRPTAGKKKTDLSE
jgi:hypothetical protein